MKKNCLSLLAMLFLTCGFVQAQEKTDSCDISVQTSYTSDSLMQVTPNEETLTKEEIEAKRRYEDVWKDRKKYFNIGYAIQTLSHMEVANTKWNSAFAFYYSMGRTFYLHKKPLFNMMKFGIDLGLPDLTYAKYTDSKDKQEDTESGNLSDLFAGSENELDLGMQQVDIGIHVGPSITLNPVDRLKICAYFHVIPSASIIMLNNDINCKFVPFLSCGGSISYKVISVGVEVRWGHANYKSFSVKENQEEEVSMSDLSSLFETGHNKLKTKTIRMYIGFRF